MEARGFGNYIIIRHANSLERQYTSTSIAPLVKPDQVVKPVSLSVLEEAPENTGPHLHFEARFHEVCD